MSEQDTQSLGAEDERRWQAQECTLRLLRARAARSFDEGSVPVDDAAIFDALSQPLMAVPPADFVSAVTAASVGLRERRRQVWRFQRSVLGGLALTYAAVAGVWLQISGSTTLRATALVIRHCLHDVPWLAAVLAATILVAILGKIEERQAASRIDF